MTTRCLVDTNLIVRYLVQDQAQHAALATLFFEACDRGEFVLIILPEVLAECVFVLESFYKHPRGHIGKALVNLIESPGIELLEPHIHRDALTRYTQTKLHFIDCVLAASAAKNGMAVATFDNGFKIFSDMRVVLNPAAL